MSTLCQLTGPVQQRFKEKITAFGQEQRTLPPIQCRGSHLRSRYADKYINH